MAGPSLIPSGDFRTTYAADTTIFPTTTSRNAAIAGIVLICFAPQVLSEYSLSILIQIGIFAIAALGLSLERAADPGIFCHSAGGRGHGAGGFDFRGAGGAPKRAISRDRDAGR